MTDPGPVRLAKDPHLPWPGEFPYDRLDARLKAAGHPGLGPAASAAEVADAGFDLLTGDATPEDHAALSELEAAGRRLVPDFFLYQLAAAAPAGGGDGDPLPDLAPLADAPPDLAAVLRPPPNFDPGPPPGPVPPDPARLAPPPPDLGPLAPDEAAVLGGE